MLKLALLGHESREKVFIYSLRNYIKTQETEISGSTY